MKTKLFLLMAIVLFACSTAKAYDALIDGIYYEFYGDHHASVTHVSENDKGPISNYSGDIIIPSTITYNGTAYTVQTIGNSAFYECTKLTSVAIPNSVIAIDNQAFYGCDALTSIIIPEGVTTIYSQAIHYCSNLKSVKIPNSVTSIGTDNFSNCLSLTDVYCYKEKIPETEIYNFQKSNIENVTLHVPYGCKAAYEAVSPWNEFGTIVEMEPENPIISFADAKVKALCVANWDTNSDGELDEAEAAAVTDLGTVFRNKNITSFNELQYFTGLTSIGHWAFKDCSGLTSVSIPNSVTSIDSQAFYFCPGLTSIKVESSNTTYDSRNDCNAIIKTVTNTLIQGCKTTTIPNSVTNIGEYAFSGCSGLTSVTIPNSVTNIGLQAFSGCSGLTSVSIPNSVTRIDSQAFYFCSGLTSVTIPNSVTRMGVDVFSDCSGLTSVNIPNSVTRIEDGTFSGCSGLTSVTIPNSVTSIGNYAFSRCSGLTSVTIPNSVTSIENSAFSGCSGLTSVSIPNSVTRIGGQAFRGCSGLTSVIIENSVKLIEFEAFAMCYKLADVYCYAKNVPSTETGNTTFKNSNTQNATLHVPYGCKAAYEAKATWNEFGAIVEMEPESPIISFADAKVKALCVANWDTNSDGELDEAEAAAVTDLGIVFKGNTEITSFNELQYFTGLTAIGENSFRGCYGLTSVIIPNRVKSIEQHAFYSCANLISINIPNSVTSICNWSFDGCRNMTSITIGNGVTNIGEFAFTSIRGVITIIVKEDNTTYDSRNNCNAIVETATNTLIVGCKNTIIPNSITCIGEQAFYSCDELTSITIPESVRSIEYSAFHSCKNLTSITIPNSVTKINTTAFSSCSGLISITVDEANPNYDSRDNCNAIIETATNTLIRGCKNTIIPSSVTCIGDWAMERCYGLSSIKIPHSITTIGGGALGYCDDLRNVHCYAIEVPSTSFYAFNCTDIEKVTLHVPYGCKAAYEAASPWNEFGTIVEMEPENPIISFADAKVKALCVANWDTNNDGELDEAEAAAVTDLGTVFKGNTEITSFNELKYFAELTTIGIDAFYGCSHLATIAIPSSLTMVRKGAFKDCHSLSKVIVSDIAVWCGIIYDGDDYNGDFPLGIAHHLYSDEDTEITELVIPEGVTKIEARAFRDAKYITSVTIPNSVTTIEAEAFRGMHRLTSINIPDGVTSLEPYTFQDCQSLMSINIPNSVTEIGDEAFCAMSKLTSANIPNNVRTIGDKAFYGCNGLTSVSIGSGVVSIGSEAFRNCHGDFNLTSFTVADDNIYYDSRNNCNAIIETASDKLIWGCMNTIIPQGIKSIGKFSLQGCEFTSIDIPSSVTSIEKDAMSHCPYLTSIDIPAGVCKIEAFTFYNCKSLASVTIPKSVTSIGNFAFEGCTGLADIYCYAKDVPNAAASYAFYNTPIDNTTLHVPYGCKAAYKASYPWNEFGTIVEMEPESPIISFADAKVKALCVANWDKNSDGELDEAEAAAITDLGIVFKENTEITSFNELQYFTGLTAIGEKSFWGCDGLTSVVIPNSVSSIGNYAFQYCSSLTSINIPTNVISIGEEAFYQCSRLVSITIPKSVNNIKYKAFSNCISLTSIKVDPDNKTFDSRNDCNAIIRTSTNALISGCKNTNIPNNVTSIDYGAFYGCRDLTSITIPNNVIEIEDEAFWACSNLTSINIPANVISIGEEAFQYCSSLTCISIPYNVKSIGVFAFGDCVGLKDVYCLAENVPNTSNYAFDATPLNSATLHVPYGCKAAYEAASPWNEFGKIVEIPIPITVGETGFATFCSPYALDFSEVEDIRAYIVSGFNQETGTLVLTRVTEVPAGEGLYIAGMPGEHQIPQTQTSMFYANLLKGVTEPTIISPTDGNYTNYILSNGSYGVGFYTLSQTGTLDAGKAYLQLPTASVAGIKALKIEFDENDDPTGIAITSNTSAEENTIYNLAGQRVSKAHRGINIVNGKKVFIK